MTTPKFMLWINFLPEVGDPICSERDKLAAQLASAEALEKEAAALRAAVKTARCDLLERVQRQWSLFDIERAACAAGAQGEPFSIAHVSDAQLRDALRALDGNQSAADVLRTFTEARVIRQHNLLSTATDEDRRDTLKRVLDWWNFGAVPSLIRFDR